MTFNTGNPIGSTDARDLSDNAENFDTALGTLDATWTDRLGVTRDSFEGRLAKGSFYRVGTFAAGYTLTNMRQTLEYSGHEYSWAGTFPKVVSAGATPATSGGIGAGAWVDRTDVALRGDLAKSVISEKLSGLYGLKNFITPEEYGALGDGAYHPLSDMFSTLADAQFVYPFVTSLSQSIDWAAIQSALNTGKVVYCPANCYVITDTILMKSGGGLIGAGVGRWVSGFTAVFQPDVTSGTTFLMYGTGAKTYTIDCISNMDVSGGVVTNPSASDAYTATAPAPSYDLLNFTNANASGVTRATLRAFSVAILIPETGCVRTENLRIAPYFNGVDGYKDITNTGIGDEWDVGIWSRSSFANEYRNLQVVGYWRLAALLKTAVPTTGVVTAEDESFYHCRFQGYKGVSIRSCDIFRITAVGTSTIMVPWSASHTFNTTGKLRSGGIDFSYTGLTFSGDKLTFTGVSNASSAVVGNTIRRNDGSNFGMAGTQFFDCYIASLYHHTRLMATSQYLAAPFSRPSECLEVSGEPVRGVQFHGGTIQGWDDVLIHLHDCGNVNFYGTYFESQVPYQTVNGGSASFGYGARMIASRQSTSTLPYAAGNTRSLRMVGCTEGNGVDFGPECTGYTSGRYVSGSGLFNPRDSFIDHRAMPELSDSLVELVSEKGHIKITPYTGKYVYVGPSSGDANVQSTAGSLNLLSGLRVRFGSTSAYWATIDSAKINPVSDNALALGQSATRFTTVYAATGTINTSDAREKTDPLPIDDAVLDAWGDVSLITFRWLKSIQEKGDDSARWHFGVIAQQVRDAFIAKGIDGTKYGLLCYDELDAEPEIINEAGSVIHPAVEAGHRWGIRPDQCLFLEAAYLRRRCERIETRLLALESQ